MVSKRGVRRRTLRRMKHDGCWPRSWFNLDTSCRDKNGRQKTPFPTAEAAHQAMTRLMAASYFNGGEMNVYLCPVTKTHWHFGHVPGQRRKYANPGQTGDPPHDRTPVPGNP